ncbi:MAG: PilZ domain-containing protein [Anaeromyxobacter sp.]
MATAQGRVAAAPAPAAPGGIRSYEDLDGGEGQALTFRPHRYAAADLAPLRCTVVVQAGGGRLECPLRDVSRNGVAFSAPATLPASPGQPLELSVRLDAHPLWSGQARVRDVRLVGGQRLVAASFGEALVDGDELRLLREVWIPGAAGLRLAEQPWRAGGAERFRARVAELGAYLEELQERLGRLEASLPWDPSAAHRSTARTALVARLRAEVAEDVLAQATAVGEALAAADPQELEAHRAWSLRQLQPLLMQAPWLHRARHKPLGYPGDYEVMNYLYERDFAGPTLFARTMGYAFMQTHAARAVRCRKDLVKEVLRRHLLGAGGRPLRLLSIAAGPARELQELLRELEELPADLEVVLFDQDRGALEHAFQRLRPLADARFPGRVRIAFLNASVRRLLRDPHLFDELGRFDVVWSAGLFDYFHEATAVRLARNLMVAAAPGAPVLIGNMTDHPHRWLMEFHLEWTLLYRSREALAGLARRAAPGAQITVLEEASGVNPFVQLEAP